MTRPTGSRPGPARAACPSTSRSAPQSRTWASRSGAASPSTCSASASTPASVAVTSRCRSRSSGPLATPLLDVVVAMQRGQPPGELTVPADMHETDPCAESGGQCQREPGGSEAGRRVVHRHHDPARGASQLLRPVSTARASPSTSEVTDPERPPAQRIRRPSAFSASSSSSCSLPSDCSSIGIHRSSIARTRRRVGRHLVGDRPDRLPRGRQTAPLPRGRPGTGPWPRPGLRCPAAPPDPSAEGGS